MHPPNRIDPDTLLNAYAQGVFPMADTDDHGAIHWYSADPRGIIPLDRFHVPDTLRQVIRQGKFEIRINADFQSTMQACMENRPEGTWISNELIAAYTKLHRMGFAHSIESWREGKLAGGLYGVSLGAAFFGESMFFRERDASKVALAALVARLKERNYQLLDCQAATRHLKKFGCIEIPADDYLARLKQAITQERKFA